MYFSNKPSLSLFSILSRIIYSTPPPPFIISNDNHDQKTSAIKKKPTRTASPTTSSTLPPPTKNQSHTSPSKNPSSNLKTPSPQIKKKKMVLWLCHLCSTENGHYDCACRHCHHPICGQDGYCNCKDLDAEKVGIGEGRVCRGGVWGIFVEGVEEWVGRGVEKEG